LNPFVAGEYYAVYGDNSTTWNLPTAWNEDVTGVSQIFVSEAAEPEQTTAGGTEPAQTTAADSASKQSDVVPTYTPEYVPQPSAAPPPPPKPRVPHPKVNWKEGIELGLKVAEGITKIIEAVQDGDGSKC
jgi:hypothetical protein